MKAKLSPILAGKQYQSFWEPSNFSMGLSLTALKTPSRLLLLVCIIIGGRIIIVSKKRILCSDWYLAGISHLIDCVRTQALVPALIWRYARFEKPCSFSSIARYKRITTSLKRLSIFIKLPLTIALLCLLIRETLKYER